MLTNQPLLLFVDILLLATSIGVLIPSTVFFLECSVALLPDSSESKEPEVPRPRIAVLVPAHNEAEVIHQTLDSLLPQLTEQDRLVIIADNCNDETASIARKYGATVIERKDQEKRGKGYALDFGVRFLETNPPDVVVFVDADCLVEQGAVERMSRVAAAKGRPVQATYLMKQPPDSSPTKAVKTFAFMVKNLVRLRGVEKLGLPGLLTGSGMAFPWSVISKAPLATGNIVEDMQLAVDLAIDKHPTTFCQDAKVTSILHNSQEADKKQTTRWVHGHLMTLSTQVPKLIRKSLTKGRFGLLGLALDLSIPPLSLLVIIWTACTGLALLGGIWGATWIPFILLAIAGLMILVSILGAWAKFGRDELSARTLLIVVPLFILKRISIFTQYLLNRASWEPTDRPKASGNQPNLEENLSNRENSPSDKEDSRQSKTNPIY